MSAARCGCPWVGATQHDRALALETGGASEFGWLVGSALAWADGMPLGPEGFPVGADELVLFAAYHDWQNRAAVIDLMADLAFVVGVYAKGLRSWPLRLGTIVSVVAIGARLAHAPRRS